MGEFFGSLGVKVFCFNGGLFGVKVGKNIGISVKLVKVYLGFDLGCLLLSVWLGFVWRVMVFCGGNLIGKWWY